MSDFEAFDTFDGLGLAELVAKGEVSPLELVEASIARIEARNGPLGAIVHTMYARARAQAADPDALPDGPFKGVPFVFKDLAAEDAGEPSTGSCKLLKDWRATEDCELVRRYKATGVIPVARANTPEFGIYAVTESELRGPARNPWHLGHTTGGSSGGSAAAVAARMVPMAHGGDGGGSIRIPSAHCGLFGLKPTRARNPMGPWRGEGWAGLVCEHVLTRSVRDSAAMLDATAGPEPGAPYHAPTQTRPFLDEVGADPGKLKIAFSTRPLFGIDTHPDCVEAVRDAARLAEELGHEVVEDCPPYDQALLTRAYLLMVATGVSTSVRAAGERAGRTPTSDDVEAATWLMKLIGDNIPASTYLWHRQAMHKASHTIAPFFQKYDVFLTPTAAKPPVEIGAFALSMAERLQVKLLSKAPLERLLMFAIDEMPKGPLSATPNTMLFNITGQPAMSVPLFWNAKGLPIGSQWVGRFGDEATLLRLAAQLEQARPWAQRVPQNLG